MTEKDETDVFFHRISGAAEHLEPGEGFSLYGPPSMETSPHFSRVASQFGITIRGPQPAPGLERVLYIVTKNDSNGGDQ